MLQFFTAMYVNHTNTVMSTTCQTYVYILTDYANTILIIKSSKCDSHTHIVRAADSGSKNSYRLTYVSFVLCLNYESSYSS